MLDYNTRLNQLRRKIAVVLLAGLVWFISLPALSVQAAGYYSGDYSTNSSAIKAGIEKAEEKMGSYANIKPNIDGDDYLESGKGAAQALPKDSGIGSNQNNPLNMLKRTGEELGNNQVQRAFGAKDYDRQSR
ncbi:hypothetical protein NUACC21_12100 [Scytonema sp. NUACC21]